MIVVDAAKLEDAALPKTEKLLLESSFLLLTTI